MSVYNEEKYLEKSIVSILNQTFREFEFVIINDGSRDSSAQILDAFASQDPRIRVHHQANAGLITSLNRAASIARGGYLARMDGDDIALPTRIEKQAIFLDSHPEVGLIGTAFYKINEFDQIRELWAMPTDDETIRKVMIQHNPFAHSSVMFRKKIFNRLGGYNLDFYAGEDYELWFRFLSCCKLANLDEPLIKWRFCNQNVTFTKQRRMIRTGLRIRLHAIKNGQYPLTSLIHLLKSIVMLLLPATIRERIRQRYKRPHILVKRVQSEPV